MNKISSTVSHVGPHYIRAELFPNIKRFQQIFSLVLRIKIQFSAVIFIAFYSVAIE